MAQRFRVVFVGVKEGPELFEDRMVQLGVRLDMVRKLIQRAPVVMKENLSLEEARPYAKAVEDAGGLVRIQTYEHHCAPANPKNDGNVIVSFDAFTMCPECGFKQPKTDICIKCRYRFTNSGKRNSLNK